MDLTDQVELRRMLREPMVTIPLDEYQSLMLYRRDPKITPQEYEHLCKVLLAFMLNKGGMPSHLAKMVQDEGYIMTIDHMSMHSAGRMVDSSRIFLSPIKPKDTTTSTP